MTDCPYCAPDERCALCILGTAEGRYRRAAARAEELRAERNLSVRQALADGRTHAQIAEATGLSRGRIGQLR